MSRNGGNGISGRWQVEASGSALVFKTRAMFGLIPVRGRYTGFAGELQVDPDGHATGALRVTAATVDTGIAKRDAHLRSKDFFYVERYPEITFELSRLAAANDAPRLAGELSIRGNTLPLEGPASLIQLGANRLRIDAEFTVRPVDAGFEITPLGLPRRARLQARIELERAR